MKTNVLNNTNEKQYHETPVSKILFLDIDGVLNNAKSELLPRLEDNYPQFDSVCLSNLHHIVEQTGCHIVISSSWRKRDLEWLRTAFSIRGFKYPERIVGETMRGYQFVEEGCHLPICRGTEIKAWIDKFTPNIRYCILDDANDMLLSQKGRFVRTKEVPGLTHKNTIRVIEILGKHDK